MGLSRSLDCGASSLKAHQRRMDVISNNIANINTVGYKSSRANFAEQLTQITNVGNAPDQMAGIGMGGRNPTQFGLGVKIGSITNNMSQGILELTDRPLDLSLQGDGFFVYNKNNQELYSRAGALLRDRDGYIVDSNSGAFLQGYNVSTDDNGKIIKDSSGQIILNRKSSSMRIPADILSAPKQTERISVSGNLNSTNPSGTERLTSINVFDNLGGMHDLSLIFAKTDNANEYAVSGQVDGVDVTLSSSVLQFNSDGTLSTPLTLTVTAADLNSALGGTLFNETESKDINIELADQNYLLGGVTMFTAPNTATAKSQDGYKSGDLQYLSVDVEGKIIGAFTNGQTEILGQVILARFSNQDGLTRDGGNFWRTSPNSGLPILGTAGEIFQSTVVNSGTLESSNVDLTDEFTNMIRTQRAFEAASRTITVSDLMLAETNQLKR